MIQVALEIAPELDRILKRARGIRLAATILTTSTGGAYTASSLSETFARARGAAVAEGMATWQLRDPRAKNVTDNVDTLAASERVAHGSQQTTEAHYRRQPRKVRPLKEE